MMKKLRISKTVSKEKGIKATYLGSSAIYTGKSKNIPVVYFITSIWDRSEQDPRSTNKRPSSRRCWGWMPTLEEAKEAVKRNSGDMAECCYYTYMVIEKVQCGIPAIPLFTKDSEIWYKWHVDPKDPNKFRGKWLLCEKPKWSNNTCGWSIG